MNTKQIEVVIGDLLFLREKLYNGIFGGLATRALTNAIGLLRELQDIKRLDEQQMRWDNDGRLVNSEE